jgi:hypothetical protein
MGKRRATRFGRMKKYVTTRDSRAPRPYETLSVTSERKARRLRRPRGSSTGSSGGGEIVRYRTVFQIHVPD